MACGCGGPWLGMGGVPSVAPPYEEVVMGSLLSDPAKISAIGVLALCLVSLAGWHVRAVTAWAAERAALVDAAKQERERLLLEARIERERIEKELASERAHLAAVYERRVEEQKEAAERLFDQNTNWLDMLAEVSKTLNTLNERVAAMTWRRG